MSARSSNEITRLLRAWGEGDRAALAEVAPLVEAELRRLAHRYLSRERQGNLLQTTALINEAYVRLIDWQDVRWENRAHFFGVAAGMMRRILVDYARRRPRAGGAEVRHVALEEALVLATRPGDDLVALDDALKLLAERDARKAQIVELRFFGGLTVEETAEVLGLAPITVMREWNKARAWLYRELSRAEAP